MTQLRIGISGWRYAGWRGNFYPEDLPQRQELPYAASKLNSIEINGSFYSLQKPAYFQQWYDETPPGFLFSVKATRFITHIRRLRDIETPLANFFASGLFCLREKLGPILWQFPPSFKYEPESFEAFLAQLPRDTAAASEMAAQHSDWMKGRASLDIDISRPLRHAVEIRHQSFVDDAFVRMLRRYKVALVVADTAGKWPYKEEITTNFLYLRLHGETELYASGYDDEALERWAERIRLWSEGKEPVDAHRISKRALLQHKHRDIYCYFDNDYKVRAPYDAQALMRKLRVQWTPQEVVPVKRRRTAKAADARAGA
ncbi:MAG TPA: DUF72 domain-containing protein [Burkholderiales bacterium]|nr:DUF72 domain-containing protein [Burkholderiales bacterium]